MKIIFTYANELAAMGHEVTVICPRKFSYVKNIMQIKPSWISLNAKLKYVPSFQEKYIPDADVVVATAWQTASVVAEYSKVKGEKYYLVQHYESLWGEVSKVDATYKLPLRKIVVSSWLKEVMEDKFGEESLLIVNPIDPDDFFPLDQQSKARFTIGMLHHDFEWKGISDGLLAYEMAKKRYPQISLKMFGARVKSIDVDCEYTYQPTRTELRALYQSCDVFLCPSWSEGFGLTSAEAMACQCALVTTDTGGSRDFAIHEETALVSPPRQPKLLAENLFRLIEDPHLLETLKANGAKKISEFTWRDSAKKMVLFFQQG